MLFFRQSQEYLIKQNPKSKDSTKSSSGEGSGFLFCAICRAKVTRQSLKIEVLGKYRHQFFNPHGILFEIGCFKEAEGCVGVGPSIAEYSWFPPYNWQIAICRKCQTHLGWKYTAQDQPYFFGLILQNLLDESGQQE